MTKLNRKVEYALMALKWLSQQKSQKVSAKELADQIHAPFDVVARVLQLMGQGGWLKSEQGAQGGYVLIQNLKEVSLFELMQMINGETSIAKCLTSSGNCEIQSQCNIQTPVTNLNRLTSEFYQGLSIDQV